MTKMNKPHNFLSATVKKKERTFEFQVLASGWDTLGAYEVVVSHLKTLEEARREQAKLAGKNRKITYTIKKVWR